MSQTDILLIAACAVASAEALSLIGMCNGDIKPANMMLSHEGTIVTIDLGAATQLGEMSLESTPGYGLGAETGSTEYDLQCIAQVLCQLSTQAVQPPEDTIAMRDGIELSKAKYPRVAALLEVLLGLPHFDVLWTMLRQHETLRPRRKE
eukprot:TRINITY_DN1275_c2_g1_i2.p2 TRINITY_DN1275_c2_g1~~TRINITY_DN1275_c2_g1_i2.p2  ORF type:complete len:149 (-),score=32.89 TRINITY_DN1275_c2_g1_i2:1140-1586(-)